MRFVVAFALLLASACNNALIGNTTPVPPVHRVPIEIEGAVVLLAEDALIESSDPVHIQRAKKYRIPQDYRASMTTAFQLAGFKVVSAPTEKHDLVAKLALAVREEPGKVYQTYRCHLTGRHGGRADRLGVAAGRVHRGGPGVELRHPQRRHGDRDVAPRGVVFAVRAQQTCACSAALTAESGPLHEGASRGPFMVA